MFGYSSPVFRKKMPVYRSLCRYVDDDDVLNLDPNDTFWKVGIGIEENHFVNVLMSKTTHKTDNLITKL